MYNLRGRPVNPASARNIERRPVVPTPLVDKIRKITGVRVANDGYTRAYSESLVLAEDVFVGILREQEVHHTLIHTVGLMEGDYPETILGVPFTVDAAAPRGFINVVQARARA